MLQNFCRFLIFDQMFKMKTWKETDASNISGNSQENATSHWDKNTTWAGKVSVQINRNLRNLQQQNLNHFTYLCLQCLCPIVAWFQQQQTKLSCASCIFKSKQLVQNKGNKIHLNSRKWSLPLHNNANNTLCLCTTMRCAFAQRFLFVDFKCLS